MSKPNEVCGCCNGRMFVVKSPETFISYTEFMQCPQCNPEELDMKKLEELKLNQMKAELLLMESKVSLKKEELFKFENAIKTEKPEIIKSGDTWVAEYDGVDYLYMESGVSYCIKNFTAKDLFREIENGEWKPISEIEITDEIAKLRPMVIFCNNGSPVKAVSLLGIIDNWTHCQSVSFRHDLDQCSAIKLATVKDLRS